mgnify:CR=1 FL=1
MIDKTGREIYQFYITKILNFCYIFVIIIPKISAIWYINYKLIVYIWKVIQMSKFKTILNKKLKLNNISKNKFAKMIGVTSVYVGQLTRGERDPSKKLQIKIADIFYEQEKEKNNFLDNIAKEKNDIPADIYNGILDNEKEWNKVRDFLKKENIIKWVQKYKQKQI